MNEPMVHRNSLMIQKNSFSINALIISKFAAYRDTISRAPNAKVNDGSLVRI